MKARTLDWMWTGLTAFLLLSTAYWALGDSTSGIGQGGGGGGGFTLSCLVSDGGSTWCPDGLGGWYATTATSSPAFGGYHDGGASYSSAAGVTTVNDVNGFQVSLQGFAAVISGSPSPFFPDTLIFSCSAAGNDCVDYAGWEAWGPTAFFANYGGNSGAFEHGIGFDTAGSTSLGQPPWVNMGVAEGANNYLIFSQDGGTNALQDGGYWFQSAGYGGIASTINPQGSALGTCLGYPINAVGEGLFVSATSANPCMETQLNTQLHAQDYWAVGVNGDRVVNNGTIGRVILDTLNGGQSSGVQLIVDPLADGDAGAGAALLDTQWLDLDYGYNGSGQGYNGKSPAAGIRSSNTTGDVQIVAHSILIDAGTGITIVGSGTQLNIVGGNARAQAVFINGIGATNNYAIPVSYFNTAATGAQYEIESFKCPTCSVALQNNCDAGLHFSATPNCTCTPSGGSLTGAAEVLNKSSTYVDCFMSSTTSCTEQDIICVGAH